MEVRALEHDKLPELLEALAEDEPTVPDELTRYVLRTAGVDIRDERALRMVSLASQRFIATVLHDSCLRWKRKRERLPQKNLKQLGITHGANSKPTLTTEDVSDVLGEQGVHLATEMYYVDPKPTS